MMADSDLIKSCNLTCYFFHVETECVSDEMCSLRGATTKQAARVAGRSE